MENRVLDSERHVVPVLRQIGGIVLSVSIAMLSVAIVLSLLNRVPALLQESGETSYATVEQAESALGLRLPLPAYFPEFLGWPPDEITAIHDQTLSVRLVFPLRRTGEPALIVYQVLRAENEEAPELPLLQPERPVREVQVPVGGVSGALRTGTDRDGRRWARLTWRAGDRDMILIANFPEQTLLTMARSIH